MIDGDPRDPFDRGRSGYSLANNRELLFGCLEAAGVRSVIEVGAEQGAFTRELLEWAGDRVRVAAIDPLPGPELKSLAAETPRLELVEETSLDAIPKLDLFDAYVIDGDHNYYTVSSELRAIEERAGDTGIPLVLFHDVCWPHARRDSYYAPERIPDEHRQPLARDARLVPWGDGTDDEIGIVYPAVAAHEGGPKNGVLTAIEDFVAEREGVRFARVPAFFGFGAMWPEPAPWAGDVAAIVEPLADHPVLERLEGNRVVHLLERLRLSEVEGATNESARRLAELEAALRPMLDSRAFALAERLSSIRRGGAGVVSRERLRRLLDRGSA